MVKLNIAKTPKDELIRMAKWHCVHGHTGIEHYNCWQQENKIEERVAALDCETTGLQGNWDYVISYALYDGNKTYGRVCKKEEVLNYNLRDRELLKEFYDNAIQFQRVIVYWGKDRRHDLPFLRTRALKENLPFPLYKEIYVTDLYDIAKNKLRLHRNRLENVAQFLKIPAKEHRLDEEIWGKGKLGDEKSLSYIWTHNKEDVITTWQVYQKLKDFVKEINTSI